MHLFPRAKVLSALLLALVLTLITGAAMAELVRIVTPGGPVKMRKKASAKSGLVTQVPNKAFVEADELGEEWCHITYNGKSGYVMTEYVVTAGSQEDALPAIQVTPAAPMAGETVEITAACEGAVSFEYAITYSGAKPVTGPQVPYATVYYRPRKAGIVCLDVTAHLADGSSLTNQTFFEIKPENEFLVSDEPEPDLIMYSQKDGWWLDKKYRSSNLDTSGCAIFTLAHALQLMGIAGENDTPDKLAVTYAFCLVEGGTLNSTLIGRAAKNYGFATKTDLLKSPGEITAKFNDGALFSFAIVSGHIALACGMSEDGTKVRIIDSAPSATFERIKDASLYLPAEDGWTAVTDLTQVPGARYYFETDGFGAMEYYLDLSYVAKRGVRLIQPK